MLETLQTMLESLLFMALMIIGGAILILTIVIIGYGIYIKEKSLRNIGFAIGLIPTFCFGLIAFWYGIAIPSFNDNQIHDYAGTYLLSSSSKDLISNNSESNQTIELILHIDGTYEFDITKGIQLEKNGTWETGGIDGNLMFYNKSGELIDFGLPGKNGADHTLSFIYRSNPDNLFETQSIYFSKINF